MVNNVTVRLTVKELYDMIIEGIEDEDFSWNATVTFDSYDGEYHDVHGMSVECNGCEIRLYE